MPLFVTDDGGNLLYKSRATSRRAAAFSLAAEEKIVSKDGNAVFCKEVVLGGKVYRFYVPEDSLVKYYGEQASAAADRLFDVAHFAEMQKIGISLAVLAQHLSDKYVSLLRKSGIYIELREFARPWQVTVPPNALLLCLALMLRLCACRGKRVKLSAVQTEGRVTIFADAEVGGGFAEIPEVLTALLYETAAAVGFAVEHYERNGRVTWSLAVAPLDIGMYGLKERQLADFLENAAFYAEMFLV